MPEYEVRDSADAAFFVANEVVNEYHAFPVVQRADISGPDVMYMQINEIWFQVSFGEVLNPEVKDKLEALNDR